MYYNHHIPILEKIVLYEFIKEHEEKRDFNPLEDPLKTTKEYFREVLNENEFYARLIVGYNITLINNFGNENKSIQKSIELILLGYMVLRKQGIINNNFYKMPEILESTYNHIFRKLFSNDKKINEETKIIFQEIKEENNLFYQFIQTQIKYFITDNEIRDATKTFIAVSYRLFQRQKEYDISKN